MEQNSATSIKHENYRADIDSDVLIYELLIGLGYQQLVFDENGQEKFSFGIPSKTIDNLMQRHKSMKVYITRYWTGDLPIKA